MNPVYIFVCVIYFSPPSFLVAQQDDVVYAYPRKEGNKITELRGLFETLPQLLADVTDNAVKSSTLFVEGGLFRTEGRLAERLVGVFLYRCVWARASQCVGRS